MPDEKILDEYSELEASLQKVFDKIVSEYDLHKNTFSYERSYSLKDGKLTSCGIYINEMTYPPVISDTILSSYLVTRHQKLKGGKLEFLIRNEQFANIELPESVVVKGLLSDKDYRHLLFDQDDVSLVPYLEQNIRYCLKNYKPSTIFGCCSSYKECSDAKKCIHPNFLYAKGCQYRQNLEAGRIFY